MSGNSKEKYAQKAIDYNKVFDYWNHLENQFINQFSAGYKIPDNAIALYRFKKELDFLNKAGQFDGNFLDLGCGTGNFLFAWQNKFDQLIGIDISEIMLEFASSQCNSIPKIKIHKDNIMNFQIHTQNISQFSLIFIGGGLMYLNDSDVIKLLTQLHQLLQPGGKVIFRESIATKCRLVDNESYSVIRRTINEYVRFCDQIGNVQYYPNYAYNYAHFIAFYWSKLSFLKNKIHFFEHPIMEFIFLYIPLSLYSRLKYNMVLDYFFILEKTHESQ